MICSKCGTEFPDESDFCWKCGTKVVKDDFIFCWKCGSKLPADCEFCNRCGTKQWNVVSSPSDETVNAAASSVNSNAAPEDTTESSAQPRQENAANTPEPNDIPDGGESDTRSPDDLTGIEFMCMTKAEIKRLQGKQAGIAEMSEYLSRLVLEEGALIHKNLRVGDSLDKASAVFNTYLNRCVSYCGDEAIATFYYDTNRRRIMLEFKLDRDFKILQAILTGEPPVPENRRGESSNHEEHAVNTPFFVKFKRAFYSIAFVVMLIILIVQIVQAASAGVGAGEIAGAVAQGLFEGILKELLPWIIIGAVMLIVAIISVAKDKKREGEQHQADPQPQNAMVGQQNMSAPPERSNKVKSKKMFVAVIIFFAVSVVISIILGSGACVSESKAVKIVKNSYFEQYGDEKIGNAFDNFLGDTVWTDFTTEGGEHIVQCRGRCIYNDKNATMVIRIDFDDEDYSFWLYSISINGEEVPISSQNSILSKIYAN